ncbi:unnamed protein product [Adineta ricciae]|uniref:Uncharacterized protein n=1 Tax=Adineta ricciae TaxID=249248 RepID=A0A814E8V6_ADIRI|nr:unnamed protein product [Adineta ricciae]CAF1336192.1 unnamed protein product [Adineta ricciae]
MTQTKTSKIRLLLNAATKTIDNCEVTRLGTEIDNSNVIEEQEQQCLHQLKDQIPPPKRTGLIIDTTQLLTKSRLTNAKVIRLYK